MGLASCGLDPVRHGTRQVMVTHERAMALRHWQVLRFLDQGVTMGSVLTRKVITTDTSLSGWGGIHKPGCKKACAVSHTFSGALSGVFHLSGNIMSCEDLVATTLATVREYSHRVILEAPH